MTKKTDVSAVLPILAPILGEELALAIIEHRDDVVRVPLTVTAAKLQAKEYLATGRPQEAAEMQILRGWRAIRKSWFDNEMRKDERNAPRRSNDMADFAADLMGRYDDRQSVLTRNH